MDFRIVHPIPLAVSDVVPEFHVLDAFGCGEGNGSQCPTDFAFGSGDDQPRRYIKATLKSDGAHDVRPIPGTARSLDITTDLVQLGRERDEVRFAEMGVLGYISDGQRDRYPASGKAAWGPVRATRMRMQREREYRGIVRYVRSLGRYSPRNARICATTGRRAQSSVRLQVSDRSRTQTLHGRP